MSGPCSFEKYPSLRMANRYTRIFDAGGLSMLGFGPRGTLIASHALLLLDYFLETAESVSD